MDFITPEQAEFAKNNGLHQPQIEKNTWFGMLFETIEDDFQYAFVGTGQWGLFKQHCIQKSIWRATPTDLLRVMPDNWALYIEERNDIYTRWCCRNLDQPVYDVFENGSEVFRGNGPCEAVFKAWSFIQSKN